MVVMSAIAQAPQRRHGLTFDRQQSAGAQYDKLSPLQERSAAGRVSDGVVRLTAGRKVSKAPARAESSETQTPVINTDVIREQPEGEVATYTRAGGAFYNYYGTIYRVDQSGITINVVTAPDGRTVYLEDLVSWAPAGTWVKGTIEGDKIHVPLYQCIDYSASHGYGYALAKCDYAEKEDDMGAYVTFENDFSQSEVTFTIGADGTLSLDGTEVDPTTDEPVAILALIYTDDLTWAGFGDFASVYTPIGAGAMTMPEGIETEDWAYTYNTSSSARNGMIVKVGVDGDKIYVEGLSETDPESVVEGTITDGKVTFASDQYLGNSTGYTFYFCAAKVTKNIIHDDSYGDYEERNYIYQPELVMDYDADKKLLTSATDDALIINVGKGADGINNYSVGENPQIGYFNEVAATPADPEVLEVYDAFTTYGYCGIRLSVKTEDTEGNFIAPDKLYYILWTKKGATEAPYEFLAADYYDFAGMGITSLTEVPYGLEAVDESGYEDISKGGSVVYIYRSGSDNYGVQSVYYGGGERRTSAVVWYSDGSEPDGIGSAVVDGTVAPESFFSLDGKSLNAPQKGLNIVRMTDGRVRKVVVK